MSNRNANKKSINLILQSKNKTKPSKWGPNSKQSSTIISTCKGWNIFVLTLAHQICKLELDSTRPKLSLSSTKLTPSVSNKICVCGHLIVGYSLQVLPYVTRKLVETILNLMWKLHSSTTPIIPISVCYFLGLRNAKRSYSRVQFLLTKVQ